MGRHSSITLRFGEEGRLAQTLRYVTYGRGIKQALRNGDFPKGQGDVLLQINTNFKCILLRTAIATLSRPTDCDTLGDHLICTVRGRISTLVYQPTMNQNHWQT